MFFLRIISFIAGSFVVFAAPFLMLSEQQGMATGGVPAIVAGALGVLLFALAYFYFALLGHRIGRSARARALAGALVVFQLAAGAWLATAGIAQVLIAAAPLLSFSVLLFLAFVWPGEWAHTHRPMRRREPQGEYLPR